MSGESLLVQVLALWFLLSGGLSTMAAGIVVWVTTYDRWIGPRLFPGVYGGHGPWEIEAGSEWPRVLLCLVNGHRWEIYDPERADADPTVPFHRTCERCYRVDSPGRRPHDQEG